MKISIITLILSAIAMYQVWNGIVLMFNANEHYGSVRAIIFQFVSTITILILSTYLIVQLK